MIIQLLPYRFKTIFPLCTVVTRTIPTTPVSWQSSSVCIVEIHCGSRQFAFGRCGSISFVPGAIDCFSINLWPIAILNGYHGSFRRLIIDVTRVRLFFFFFSSMLQTKDRFFFFSRIVQIFGYFIKILEIDKIRENSKSKTFLFEIFIKCMNIYIFFSVLLFIISYLFIN